MPHVHVRRNRNKISDEMAEVLKNALPGLVSRALTVPGTDCELTEEDVGVEMCSVGPFDVISVDLEIMISAGDHPDRRANFDERREMIEKGVKNLSNPGAPVEEISGFVWICLSPDSFEEFTALWD